MDATARQYLRETYSQAEVRRAEQGLMDARAELAEREGEQHRISTRLAEITDLIQEASPRATLVLLADRDRWRDLLHRARANAMSTERRAWGHEAFLDRGRAVLHLLRDEA